jgi:hypothetical protein
MDDRIAAAIANNVALYESVFRARRLGFARRSRLWLALDPAPAWYSDAITLAPDIDVEEIATVLGDRERASVKDSFANLYLSPAGFRELFAAEWIYKPAPPSPAPRRLAWRQVESPAEMARYRELHGTADSLIDNLLADPDIALYLGERGGAVAAGTLFNRSGADLGISNVFILDIDPVHVWADLVSLAAEFHPGRALVGYEPGEDLGPALAAGFTTVGPLRIWVK